MATPIAALDIGTTKTCALIGEQTDAGAMRILGVGVALSRGLRKGVVTDVKEASLAIASAVEQAERVSGMSAQEVYVGIAGAHIQSTNSRGVAGIHGGRGIVNSKFDQSSRRRGTQSARPRVGTDRGRRSGIDGVGKRNGCGAGGHWRRYNRHCDFY
jgi:cell division protein FtsA